MSDLLTLSAEPRERAGKGASRALRREGRVPAVIYGHGEKPIHIALPAREVGVALKTSNVLLDIDLGSQVELTLPKSVVRDPIKGTLEHIDLILVRRGEPVLLGLGHDLVALAAEHGRHAGGGHRRGSRHRAKRRALVGQLRPLAELRAARSARALLPFAQCGRASPW